MIMVVINKIGVRHTLIDNGLGINVCSNDLLIKLGMDRSLIQPNALSIHGFDDVGRRPLGIITLPIKVGLIVLPTLIHVILDVLSYNILLGRPCIHAMGGVPSTLHRIVKYTYNKVYIVKDYSKFESYL